MNRFFLILFGLLWLGPLSSPAQFDPAAASALDFAMLAKLFGPHTNFSAQAELRVIGNNQKEKISTPLDFALRDRKLRVQIETAKVKNSSLPVGAVTAMQELGLDRVVSLVRPDRQATYVIFPGLKAFIKTPFSAADQSAFSGRTQLLKTPTGNETVDGHPCVKKKIVLTDARGGKHEIIVWEATDLRGFPLQIHTRDGEDSVMLRFRQVQLTRPEPRQFDLPTGYQEHKDVRSFMTSVMAQLMKQIRP